MDTSMSDLSVPAAAPASAAAPSSASLTASETPVSRDALAMEELLTSLGLPPGSYQPRVIAQLLEVSTRYTREVLEDAADYCAHRDRDGRSHIEPDDVEIAVQTRLTDSFVQPPPKEVRERTQTSMNGCELRCIAARADIAALLCVSVRQLLYSLAATQNSIPLPIVPTREGVHLPADRFCLMQPNYRVKTSSGAGTGPQRKQQNESKHNL